ncbi:MAG TPA: acyltransferase [Drouetiella sp.]
MPTAAADPNDLTKNISLPSETLKREKIQRLPQLDFLRGVAILLVLLSHQVYQPPSGAMKQFAEVLHVFGQTGVDLFFVLSGFLVGSLLLSEILKTKDLRIGNFLIRRGMKIWPGYYVFIAVAFVHRLWHHEDTLRSATARMWPLVFNLQNYLGPFDVVGHCWSLAVEEHFYLILPLLFAFLCRAKIRRISFESMPKILIGIILTCIALRFVVAWNIGQLNPWLKFTTHSRMDALFLGVLVAYFYKMQPNWFATLKRHNTAIVCVGMLLLSLRIFTPESNAMMWSVNVVATYLGHALCLVYLLQVEPGVGLVGNLLRSNLCKLLCFVGLYSYSIYLWHFEFVGPFVMYRLLQFIPDPFKFFLGMFVYIVGAIIFGVIAAKLIEQPMLRIRERVFPSTI